MKNEKFRLVHPSDFKNHVRTRYLEIAALKRPKVFEELRLKAFPVFFESNLKDLFNPLIKSDFTWVDFEKGNLIDKNTIELREKLVSWQKRLYLVEDNLSDKWVLRWLVCDVLGFWANSSNLVRRKHLFLQVGQRSPLLPPLPSFNPPDFVINDQMTNIQFIEKSSSEFIDFILAEYRKILEPYCREVEASAIEYGWISSENVSVRDLMWTVESQIEGLDFSNIANVGTLDPLDKIKKRQLLNPLELSKDDLDIQPVDPSTVSRAVEKTLKILGIKSRKKKKGRPLGNHQIGIKKLLMD